MSHTKIMRSPAPPSEEYSKSSSKRLFESVFRIVQPSLFSSIMMTSRLVHSIKPIQMALGLMLSYQIPSFFKHFISKSRKKYLFHYLESNRDLSHPQSAMPRSKRSSSPDIVRRYRISI